MKLHLLQTKSFYNGHVVSTANTTRYMENSSDKYSYRNCSQKFVQHRYFGSVINYDIGFMGIFLLQIVHVDI